MKSGPKLIKALDKLNNVEIYENQLIQAIVNFKWHAYAKKHFTIQLLQFLIFSVCFHLDIQIFQDPTKENIDNDQTIH